MVSAGRSNMWMSDVRLALGMLMREPPRCGPTMNAARDPGSRGARGARRRLRLQSLVPLGDVDDETCVGAGGNRLDLVLGGHFERDLAPVDRLDDRRDLDLHSEQC